MKKIYFFGLMSCFALANAQAPKVLNGNNQPLPVQKKLHDYVPASPVLAPHNIKPVNNYLGKTSNPPVKVGETLNDRQANASIYRRIITYPGNKISVAWMTSNDGPSNGFLGRGTGYNHYNGTTWGTISNQRIEQNRTGYPCLDYSAALGKETVFSHRIDTGGKSGDNSKSYGLSFNKNLSLGSTTWSGEIVLDTPDVSTHPSVLWPRTAISGNYIHVVANYTVPSTSQPDSVKISGVKNPSVYSRYNTATSTWEVKNITLPGYDGTRWYDGQGDGYSIDASGSTVAILMGGTGTDITLFKSVNNGQTWTSTIIDSFVVAAFKDQVLTDTGRTCDGTLNVKLDATGNAHCFWGKLNILNPTEGDNTYSVLISTTNAINYWYEGRPSAIVPAIGYGVDVNVDGVFSAGTVNSRSRYGNSGIATMPYATIDATGRVFMIYSALGEGDDDGSGSLYRHVYCVYSTDNGVTWSTPRAITRGLSEQMFACVAQGTTDMLQMTYMETAKTGFYDATDNTDKLGPFDIMYYAVPIQDILDNKVGIEEAQNEVFSLNQNFPNPFNGSTTIPVNLKKNSDVKISIVNLVGQTVYANSFANTAAGNHNFDVNLSNMNHGVYFYTVEAEGYKITKRMIVE